MLELIQMIEINLQHEFLPIGDAYLGLKGGILRAEHVLSFNNAEWLARERNVLRERLEELKISINQKQYDSIPIRRMLKNASILISDAESILEILNSRLFPSIRLVVDNSTSL